MFPGRRTVAEKKTMNDIGQIPVVEAGAPPARVRVRGFILVALLGVLLWGGEYLRRDLWEPDEARYAYIAREMRDSGRWFMPQRHGEYYAHKPPLMFWLINLSASVFTGGKINAVSARLPSLAGSIISLWVVWQLMLRWKDRDAAVRAVLVLMTSFLFWYEGGMGQIDALLCGLEMLAMYFLITSEGAGIWRPMAAYTAMGLAVLAKGPVGFIVPLGAYICATIGGGRREELRAHHWFWGPLVMLAFPGLWLLLAWLTGAPDGYFNELIFKQSSSRVLEGTGHNQGFHYFLWHFPLEFLPWTLCVPAAWIVLGQDGEDKALRRSLLAWVVFVIGLFSLFTDKRQLYVLFAMPPAAMLVASGWIGDGWASRKWARVLAGVATAILGVMGAVLVVCGVPGLVSAVAGRLPFAQQVLLPSGFALLAGSAVCAVMLKFRHLTAKWHVGLAGALLVNQFCIAQFVYPALNPSKAPYAIAEAAKRHIPDGGKLLIYKVNGEILALYAGCPGLRVRSDEELLREIGSRGRGMVVFEVDDWKTAGAKVRAALTERHVFRMGNKKIVWAAFGRQSGP